MEADRTMKFHVFLTPMHVVEIECDHHDQVSGVHRFTRGAEVIAEFATSVGWMQIREELGVKASVSPLTLVSSNTPKAPVDPAA
jgi:hypothetical protein